MVEAPKILIVQLGRLGDFILATPMFRGLKQAYPACRIHVLASRHNAELARMQSELERVYVHSKKLGDTLKLLAALKRERYDWWIDPKDHYSHAGSFFARWANAERKVGFNRREGRKIFEVELVSLEENHTHAAQRNLAALRALGLAVEEARPSLHVEAAAQEALARFLRTHGLTRYVCVNLSAGNEIRYWPLARWNSFLRLIQNEARDFVLIAEAKDAHLAHTLTAQFARAFYFPTRSLGDLLAVVQRAEIVVSPDTAVIHVAAAFDRPVLGLYSNHEWNYKKFYPLSTHCRVALPPWPGGLIKDISCESAVEKFNELSGEIAE
jgi:ADP-heptose:LPS heptosyltransferase